MKNVDQDSKKRYRNLCNEIQILEERQYTVRLAIRQLSAYESNLQRKKFIKKLRRELHLNRRGSNGLRHLNKEIFKNLCEIEDQAQNNYKIKNCNNY